MNKRLIRNLPLEVLRENESRLEIAIDELQYFYESLQESKVELQTTNEMLKYMAYQIMNPQEDLRESTKTSQSLFTVDQECEEVTVSLLIQEEIDMPKRNSLPSYSQKIMHPKRKSIPKRIRELYN